MQLLLGSWNALPPGSFLYSLQGMAWWQTAAKDKDSAHRVPPAPSGLFAAPLDDSTACQGFGRSRVCAVITDLLKEAGFREARELRAFPVKV